MGSIITTENVISVLRDTFWLGPIEEGEGGKVDIEGLGRGYPGTGMRRPQGSLYGMPRPHRKNLLDNMISRGMIVEKPVGYLATPHGVSYLYEHDYCEECGYFNNCYTYEFHCRHPPISQTIMTFACKCRRARHDNEVRSHGSGIISNMGVTRLEPVRPTFHYHGLVYVSKGGESDIGGFMFADCLLPKKLTPQELEEKQLHETREFFEKAHHGVVEYVEMRKIHEDAKMQSDPKFRAAHPDGGFWTSLWKQLNRRGYLTPKQIGFVRHEMTLGATVLPVGTIIKASGKVVSHRAYFHDIYGYSAIINVRTFADDIMVWFRVRDGTLICKGLGLRFHDDGDMIVVDGIPDTISVSGKVQTSEPGKAQLTRCRLI